MNIEHKISHRELLKSELLELKRIIAQHKHPEIQERFASQLIALNQLESDLASTEKLLVVLLLGGTGVGKSTFLNAIAGENIARSSHDVRGYTKQLNVYHYQDTSIKGLNIPMPFDHYAHDIVELENILIIDAPDIDSVYEENQVLVEKFLPSVDIAIYVTSYQKYRNEHIHSFIKKLKGSHHFLFVMNQMDFVQTQKDADILMDDFHSLLAQDFQQPYLLRISAKECIEKRLQSKLKLNPQITNRVESERDRLSLSYEQDFIRLMRYFYHEIEREEFINIKKKGIIAKLREMIAEIYLDLTPKAMIDQHLDHQSRFLYEHLSRTLAEGIAELEKQYFLFELQHKEIFVQLKELLEHELKLLIHLKRDQHCGGIYGVFLKTKKFGFAKIFQDLFHQKQSEIYHQMPIYIDQERLQQFFYDRYLTLEQHYHLSLEQIRLKLAEHIHLDSILLLLLPASIKNKVFDRWESESTQAMQSHQLSPRQAWEIHFLPNLFAVLMFVFLIKRWINGGEIGLFSLLMTMGVIYAVCYVQYLFFSRNDMAQFNIDLKLEEKYEEKLLYEVDEIQKSKKMIGYLKDLKNQLDDLWKLDEKLEKQAKIQQTYLSSSPFHRN